MRTLILQNVLSWLVLAFAFAAVQVGRSRAGLPRLSRLAWLLTGVTFGLYGASSLVQDVYATRAFFAGAGTPAYDLYLRYAPVANHGRTFAMFAYCGGLMAFILAPRLQNGRGVGIVFALVVLFMVAGGVYGAYEGALVARTHYTAVGLLNTLELILMLGTLFVALANNAVDRLLWFALGTYSFSVALNIFWMLALSGLGFAWAPAPWQMAAYRVVLAAVLAAVGFNRLRLVRRNLPVSGLLGVVPERATAGFL